MTEQALNTPDASRIVQAVGDLLQANQSLELKRVWVGDDPTRVPVWPSAAVLAGPTATGGGSPTGSGMGLNYYTNNNFTIYVLVFFAKVTQDEELQQAANKYAEQTRDALHENKTLNGLAYQGWVTLIEPGVARRQGAKFRANRLTVRYDSKTFI